MQISCHQKVIIISVGILFLSTNVMFVRTFEVGDTKYSATYCSILKLRETSEEVLSRIKQ
jgi:hypothetical protein